MPTVATLTPSVNGGEGIRGHFAFIQAHLTKKYKER